MINKLSLNEQIYEAIRKDIFTNKIKNGSILVNKDLQERFDVSSSPIRDAINRLEQDGLICKITRAGAEVITLDYDKTKEINELMQIITSGSITLAIKSENKKELDKKLIDLLKIQKEYLNTDKYFYYDYCFHKLFFEYSNNEFLIKIYNQYNVLFEMAVRSLDALYNNESKTIHRQQSFECHEKITESFINNNLEETLESIKEHYNHADEIFEKYY